MHPAGCARMRTCVILHKKCLSLNGVLSAKTPSFILKPKNKAKSGLFGYSKLNENVKNYYFYVKTGS